MAKQSSTFVYIARNAAGQTTAEYAVILTMITLSIFLAVAFLATNLGSHITDIAKLLP